MLNFKNIELKDIDLYKRYTADNKELSCENNFVNLLVWQCTYNNMMAEYNGRLYIKSGAGERETFRLPIGDDIVKGMEDISEYCGKKNPPIWTQEGELFYKAKPYLEERYVLSEKRNACDYIYLQSNLANLSGKKYHSKRNHISAFSKKYDWHYEDISENNIEKVRKCAEKWYEENTEKEDTYLLCEKNGLEIIIENMELLSVKGGAILVDDNVVAFTFGSPINSEVFDIHIEKALKDYAEGYTVINREFARRLEGYKYINREDDMGLEGLRKAKLSYKPEILLNKYFCLGEGNE